MAFDPSQPFSIIPEAELTGFDPSKPFKVLSEKDLEPVGTSVGQEISQLPAALKQSFGQPLEAIGETAQVAGFPAVTTALKGAIQEPQGYVSAGQRFMEPQEGEFQVAGFAPQYAPRAIAEQTGQILGSIGSRIAGAATLGGLGALISPATGVAGAVVGQFAGPALFEAAQIVGPVALERAKNNGYTEPTDEDMAYAVATAAGSGLLNAFGAKYLPGGEKAVGSFSKRLAASFIGEGIPEGLQSLVQQVGETVETNKGIQVNPKQAVGEALIGGSAGAAATIASAPFTPEQIAEAKITESANKEAENLVIGNDNPQGKAALANKQKLEQEVADTKQVLSAIESTDPIAQKLKLELKEKEAILAAAQGQVDSIVDSNNPVAEAEKQQIELAKAITEPTPKPLPTDVLPTETPGATYGREAEIFDVFAGARRKPVEVTPTIKESLPVDQETPAAKELQIGDEITIMQVPSVLADTKKIAGVKWDIFNGAKLAEKRAAVRITDEESGEVLQIKQFKNYNEAETYFKTETDKAQKLEKPAPEAPAITPAPVAETPTVTEAPAAEVAQALPKAIIQRLLKDGVEIIPSGNQYSGFRQLVMEKLGKPSPKSKSGTNAVKKELIQYLGVDTNDTIAGIDNSIRSKLRQMLENITAPTPAVSETITPAEGISVGNRIKLGKSPQTYIVEQVVPQSEVEKANDEQYYSVKNEKTGEVQVVEKADMKQVGGKGARKMSVEVIPKQESVTPIPEANRYTFKEAVKAVDAHFGKKGIPEGVVIVNNTTDPDLEMKAGYFVNRGQIVINLAYIAKGENLGDIIDHELGHYIFGDPEFQADFKQFWDLMTPEEKAKADQIINQFYNKETGAIQMEEKQIRAFMQLIQDSKAMPKWKQLLDKIKRWINEKLGTNLQVTDRGALAVLAAAHKRFKSGERIVREIDSGVLKSAETAQDAEYLAAVERGDMETAQRMVDEAAKPSTHTFIDASQTQSNKIRWTDSANNQIEFYKSQIAKLPSVAEATNEYKALVKAWNDAGLSQTVEDTIKGIIELKLQPPPSSLDEYLQTRIYLERKGAEAEIKKSQETLSRAPKGKTETEFKTGRPTIVKAYHSTPFGRLTEFSDEMLGRFTGAPSATKAHFFAGSPSVSETYFADDAWLLNHKGFFSLSGEQKKQLIDSAREELQNGLDSRPDEIADLAMSLFDIDTYDTSPYENVKHDVYIRLNNPLVYDFKGAGYRDVSYNDLLVKAAEGGYDGVIMANTTDPGPASTLGSFPEPTNIIAVLRGHSSQIKSADPVTFDDAGNVIPLSQRFQPSEPDIRRMAVRRTKIMRVEAGEEVDSPEGIIAKTKALLRKQFDPTKVTEQNTTEAFRALGRLTGKDGTAFAQELNDIGRIVDESGAASEISMGAALFINDLFEYSIRLAAEGNKMMLGIMLTNINKLPTAAIGASDAARALRARLELAQRFLKMAQAEQDAYTNYVAEFIYGPNPTKDQIQSIKDAYAAVEKTPQVTEQELTDEIKAVGDRSGTDLVGKINEEFTKATEKGREKRKTEEAELDEEYKKIQNQADAEIEKLAKIQSDTPSFDPTAARQITNDVRAIVANDLKQRPDMERKAPWKSMLVAKLQEAGVEVAAAETLADIVWRQHEINNLSRELSSINKAIEKGPISEIVKAIKDTPLEDQQNPNWRYEVMRDYLRRAGLSVAQAERIAKLMDISLQKRFTMAQEQAFTDAISKTAPWKTGDTRSRRAFQKVLQALRAGALDPARNVLSDMAALNGWTGFSPDQYKTLLKNDAILADPKSADATKAEAHKAIQDIISKAKLPIRARDVIGQFYDAQALSGIPTVTVNIFSPAGVAVKNALTQSLNGVLTARPEQITASLTTFIDSIKSWANTVAFSFKNNVTVYSNVEYLVNDEGLLKLYKKGLDQFNNGKTPRDKADGVKNMMIGMMDYVRRVLNALDYGAIASLQNQAVSKYALAAMQAKGMSSKDGAKMLNAMMEEKRNFYNEQIAIGTDKNKAAVLADEFFISSWRQALTDAKLPAQEVMDAALNDAMSAVGRNRQSLDAFREEETNIRDNGVTSFPAIWLLETMANAANKQESQFIKIFSRVIYGFAVVPARVLRETAWFSPYGAVRFAYDAIAKKMGKTSPYAQSLGNDLQYRQRLTETIAGSLVMLAFAAAMSASTEDEEDEKPFKIVVTGNGPLRNEDPQYYDSWMKKNKPNTASVYFGKTKFTINTMRGFEAFAWPAMMLGAVDDWNIRRKQKRETNTPKQMGDAAIVAGFVLSASLRRGPYAFAAKPLFEAYGDRGVESLAKSLAFPVKTIIPVLGSSLAGNISNFLNEPVDRKTLEGALWSNIPFIGPAVAPKSLNAFGEPSLSTDFASKMFKLGVPIVYDIPTDRQSVMLHELVLKQGGGPSIPTRNQLAQRLDRQPTNKEYEMFVREYGTILTNSMKKNYDKLFNAKPEFYSKAVERIGNRARDIAENKVRQAAKKP